MDTFALSGHDPSARRGTARAAFSLVEVTMAIGIIAFAFISLLGLIPTGLTTFRRSMDASTGSQIAERLLNEAQQSDFATLTAGNTSAFRQTSPATGANWRYFDDQGNELSTVANALYQVNTVVYPRTSFPSTGSASAATANANLATVVIQVANNPGGARTIQTDTIDTLLWNDAGFTIATYTGKVSRNR